MTTYAYSLSSHVTTVCAALCTALWLTACGTANPTASEQSVPPIAQTPSTPPATTTAPIHEWQDLRARHLECAQGRAYTLARTDDAPPRDVAIRALRACEQELTAMRKSFQQYLEAQMVTSHGKAGAYRAAERMTRDAERKAREYLEPFVTHIRHHVRTSVQ